MTTVILAVENKENHIKKILSHYSSVEIKLHYQPQNKEVYILNGRKKYVHQRHNIHNHISKSRAFPSILVTFYLTKRSSTPAKNK